MHFFLPTPEDSMGRKKDGGKQLTYPGLSMVQ